MGNTSSRATGVRGCCRKVRLWGQNPKIWYYGD
jgi:hypothetical protein